MEWIQKEISDGLYNIETNNMKISELKNYIRELEKENKQILKDVEAAKNLLVLNRRNG